MTTQLCSEMLMKAFSFNIKNLDANMIFKSLSSLNHNFHQCPLQKALTILDHLVVNGLYASHVSRATLSEVQFSCDVQPCLPSHNPT